MESVSDVKARLKELFDTQRLAVLATQEGSQHYTSLMSFAATEDLKHIVFVTSQSTRKYANLEKNSQVALLIDSRTNRESDIREAIAVTAVGKACEVKLDEKESLIDLYRTKHPHLDEFLMSPSQVLIKVTVQPYVVVSKFQKVYELVPTS